MSATTHLVTLGLCLASWVVPSPAQELDIEGRVDGTIRERGVLESVEETTVRSPMDSTILAVLQAGTAVESGDLLVRFDSATLDGQLREQQARCAASDAAFGEMEAQVAHLERESESRLAMAELAVEVAELELLRFTGEDGELARRVREADAELTVARERHKSATRLVELRETRLDSGLSVAEKTSAALAVVEAKGALEIAEANRKLLEKYGLGHETAALQLELGRAQLLRLEEQHESQRNLQRAKADLRAAEAKREAEKQQLVALEQRIAACAVYATRAGVVLHAAPAAGRTRAAEDGDIQVGTRVRQGQPILSVADMTRMHMRVNVHETRINRVRVGQRVELRIDAMPGNPMVGKVTKMNPIPEPTQWIDGNVKEYAVWVSVVAPPKGLKIGMTGLAEIFP